MATATAAPDRIFYVGTRGPNEPLYSKYPWLQVADERDRRVLGASGGTAPPPLTAGPAPQSARDLLDSILGDKGSSIPPPPPPGYHTSAFSIDTTRLEQLLGTTPHDELRVVYKGVEEIFPKKCLVVINRIDKVCAKFGISEESLIQLLHKDLCESAKANLLIVWNKSGTDLDHLVGGVVSLKEFGGGMVFLGQISLDKLSGVKIKQPKYLYNILDGRFKLLQGITHM